MSFKKFFPTSNDPFLVNQEDMALAKFGHLNALVDELNSKVEDGSVNFDTISELTTNAGVTVDGLLIKDGGVTANSMYAGFYPVDAAQSLSGAGAVNVTSFVTKFTSTGGAQALTLANGTQIGQMKKIHHIVDGGSGVLTPTSLSGGTNITFTTVNEVATLIWNGTAWVVLELVNLTAGGAAPALA